MPFIPDDSSKDWTKGPPEQCLSPDHLPPNMMVFPRPGVWVCPQCGLKTIVGSSRTLCNTGGE